MNHTSVVPRIVEYPSSDGQPMAETPAHRDVMIDAIRVLSRHFARRPDVYVSGDMLMYYEEGTPRKWVAPDVFVVVGADRDEDRDTYLLWREPKAPDFVLEVTSKSTRRNDQITKHTLYESLGVAEYFLFDPKAEYLNPPLQGFGLRRGRYVPLEAVQLPGGAPALYSEVLGLSLHARGRALRLRDPATGEDLLTLEEESAARGEAEARAERESAARGEAEAHAERESAARRAAEAESAELRARLRELERSARASGHPQS